MCGWSHDLLTVCASLTACVADRRYRCLAVQSLFVYCLLINMGGWPKQQDSVCGAVSPRHAGDKCMWAVNLRHCMWTVVCGWLTHVTRHFV